MIHEKISNAVTALRFLISQINVGGRVSDHKDQLIVNSLMNAYYQDDLSKLGHINQYQIPTELQTNNSIDDYLNFVKSNWSDSDIPELFGLDQISIIISKTQKGKGLLQTMLNINASSSSSSASSNIEFELEQID